MPVEAKYTPGPWEHGKLNSHCHAGTIPVLTVDGKGTLSGQKLVASVCGTARTQEATARLIAAAPEIAICLEAMLKITCGNCEGGDDRCGDACMVAQQAKAALAKARGE